MRIGARKGIFA